MGGISYLRLVICLMLALNFVPNLVWAAGSTDYILISEVATGTSKSASQEFIELYNPTDEAIDLAAANWRLKKSSSSDGTPITITLTGIIQPRGFYLLASTGWYAADDSILSGSPAYWTISKDQLNGTFNAMLSESGGHLRLVKDYMATDPLTGEVTTTELEIDRLGWGTAVLPESATPGIDDEVCNPVFIPGQTVASAAENSDNTSLRRCFSEEGALIDIGNNAADFTINGLPTPTTSPISDTEEEEPEEPVEDDPETEPPTPEPDHLALEITEIFPDPASPQSDGEDEFVEIHNPHSTTINLKDYTIQTGSNLQYSFKLPNVNLPAGGYWAFYSREGQITLANSGGRVQLLDPGGALASALVKYPAAVTGETYALINDIWVWTNRPTPAKTNLSRLDPPGPAAPTNTTTPSVSARSDYPRLMITETLPDPTSPLKDAEDEFVEIYNPNTFVVSLKGYILRSGSTLKTKYSLPNAHIKPGQYLVYFSDKAKLSLPNKGGFLRLEGENGQLIYEITPYPKAPPGAAWALVNGKWQWSARPTPAAGNQAVAVSAGKANPAVQALKDQLKSQDALKSLITPAVIGPSRFSSLAVGTAAVLALGYLLYEFRHDLRSQLYLLRKRFKSIKG